MYPGSTIPVFNSTFTLQTLAVVISGTCSRFTLVKRLQVPPSIMRINTTQYAILSAAMALVRAVTADLGTSRSKRLPASTEE